MTFVIEGPPRTKKNHNRIITRKRDGRQFVIPSSTNEAWTKSAVKQLRQQWALPAPAEIEVNLRALVYRERNVGDLIGYLQAVCDALEEAGVLKNDRLVVSFDGSRRLKDSVRPRVELELTPA